MKKEEITIYQFDELPTERAKENARTWLRQLVFSDSSDWEFIFEDAERIANILGITFDRNDHEPAVYFSGFSCQGDGACFEGSYSYAKGAHKKIREYAPADETLHDIADNLFELQKRHGYRLSATTKQSGHYYHSGCMNVEVSKDDADTSFETDKELTDILRRFANWIYKQLEAEHDYQTSDEAIEDSIRANEYEFTTDGRRYT